MGILIKPIQNQNNKMALETFTATEVTVAGGESMNLLGYQGSTYLKMLDGEAGTPTDYLLQGTGDPITLSYNTSLTFKHTQKFLLSDAYFINDDKGGLYSLVLKNVVEVLEKDSNGVPVLVGRQPGGRFGKG